jgi:class 3 adenylate cyclase/predicted ATPase
MIGKTSAREGGMTIEDPATPDGLRCPGCGNVNPNPRRFCGECGADLQRAIPEAPERRYLTVMFCDVVGSTALSERLDPEELGDVILAYREVVAAATVHFGGFVARYVGDGVLIYFGYPKAHGDDPVRALHTSLEILAGMRKLSESLEESKGIEVPIRIGVHTGLVVVGDLARGTVREEAGVVGETPNIAARVMGLAAANSVYVSSVTHSLIRRHFDCLELGESPITGLSRPISLYRVVAARVDAAGAEFSDSIHVTALVNRAEELSVLDEKWRRVVGGSGEVVLLSGEPGIGKSRLVRAFGDSLVGTNHRKIVLNCSPYFSNSAFYPVVHFLNRWLDLRDGDKLTGLAAAIAEIGMSPPQVVPVLASLLSIPLAAPYRKLESSSAIQRGMTMDFLREWMTRLAADTPTLIVVEDLHWADASTLELATLLLSDLGQSRILLLLALRPGVALPIPLDVSPVRLERLSTSQVHEMIACVTGALKLPLSVIEQVSRKTDGIPLFVEELTKAVVEIPRLADTHAKPSSPAIDLDIPISLHATLMARLDSLAFAKGVAQRAAVLGREFSYELIAAATPIPQAQLERGLAELVEAELLFQRGSPPRADYVFKHSMIQETAYRSLLRAQRRGYHWQIAKVLVAQFPQVASTQPELVAHHFSAAHRPIEAAGYWRNAGEQALARSANIEARAHIRKGLAELAAEPESPPRTKEEVMLLIALGLALSALEGSAAPEVGNTYARAEELCRKLDDPEYLFPALRGMQSFYLVHGPLRTARRMVEQLDEMAERAGNSSQRVEAQRRLGWCLFCMGEITEGRRFLVNAVEQYDRSQSSRHIVAYGSDPGVIGLVNLAWLEWFSGRVQGAVVYSDRAIELARGLSYGLGLAYALGMSAALYQSLGDVAKTEQLAQETIELAKTHGFPYWVAWETGLLGWARASSGAPEMGIRLIEEGLASYRATGAELFCPHLLGLLAGVNLDLRQYDRAMALCDEALASSERTDAHFYDSEIHRIEGLCLLARDGDLAGASACFGQAIALARQQGARMLELRSAIALARISSSQGRRTEAAQLLSESFERIESHYPCADLATAGRLLEEWSR